MTHKWWEMHKKLIKKSEKNSKHGVQNPRWKDNFKHDFKIRHGKILDWFQLRQDSLNFQAAMITAMNIRTQKVLGIVWMYERILVMEQSLPFLL
jgi:hypothetical protein